MNQGVLTGTELKKMFVNGYKNLCRSEKQINELNVFPVPDGDTGTNMVKTLAGGVMSVESENGNVSEIMEKISMATLLNARGNSGVILSQFVRGFASGCEGVEELNVEQFTVALQSGVDKAYTAVLKPVEGTMLTVVREGVEAFAKSSLRNDFLQAYTFLVDAMKLSLSKTPEKLPVLREAGVVDSGAVGMICIFEGMKAFLHGEEIDVDKETQGYSDVVVNVGINTSFGPDSVLEYGYCTEFVLQLLNAKTDIDAFDKQACVEHLEAMGDSIVVVLDKGILKVHIHSFEPEKVLAFARQYGEFISVKIENMSIQHNEYEQEKKKQCKYAVVAVSDGDGLKQYFENIGAAKIIEGGQTKNPSTAEFVNAFNALDAECIAVLPNNSNIILTACQAKEMCPDKDICIIPTKNMAEGFSSLSMMDLSACNKQDFIDSLTMSLENVTSVSIAVAVHDANLNGVAVKDGGYIGVVDGNLMASAQTCDETVMMTLEKIQDIDDKQVVTLLRGKNVSEQQSEELAQKIEEKYPLIDVGIIYGGQDIYDYYIAVE